MIRQIVFLVVLILGGCGRPGLEAVPQPDLGRVEEAVRRQLEAKADEVAALADATPGERAEAWGELGRLYHAYDFLSAAESCYENARTLAPDDFRWPYYLGFLHQVRGELEPAAERFREALARRRDDLPALLRLGDVLIELDRPAQARPFFERALELDPSSAAAHHGLGKVAAREDDPAAAARHFERALELQPAATLVHYPLAQAYRALGEREKAEDHLARRGYAGPTFADPLVRQLDETAVGAGLRLTRAGVALAEGRRDAAIEEYRQAVAADPSNVEARLALGTLLAQAGSDDEAKAHLSKAIELDPRHPRIAQAHLRLGEVLQRLGDPAAAEHYAQAMGAGLAEPRELAAAHLGLGNLLAARRDDEAAAGHYRAALETAPDLAEAHFNLAGVLGRLGRREDGMAHYRKVIELQPENVAARLYLAQDLAAAGRYGEALAVLEAARAALPESDVVAHTLARLLAACPDHSLRDGPRAVELALGALESRRERPPLEYAETVAMAFAEAGNFEEAVKWQREVIAAAERAGDSGAVEVLRRNLARYERGDPVL